MRILVDHSGPALLNIGDIAMLQACVHRLQALWPEAEIYVYTESLERLREYCPNVRAVGPTIAGRAGASILPMSGQLMAECSLRFIMPLLVRSKRTSGQAMSASPTLLEAIRAADLVVSSGGGFINDVFWWHGAGVLSILSMAQRLGKPTAMFGQGVGPLTHPMLSRMVKHTMPRLDIVGVREELLSVPLLRSCGVDSNRICVTGDDALLLATRPTRPRTGTALGVNIRVAAYSGVGLGFADRILSVVKAAAGDRGAPTVPLPVSRYEKSSDLNVITSGDTGAAPGSGDIRTPQELADRVAQCRVVVTGSYHAAVFGLGVGIPAVCITNSAYYDRKFHGLAALFPGACQLVAPGSGFETELSEAIERGWEAGEDVRNGIHLAARTQVAKADHAYHRFKAIVDTSADDPILKELI